VIKTILNQIKFHSTIELKHFTIFSSFVCFFSYCFLNAQFFNSSFLFGILDSTEMLEIFIRIFL